MKLHVNTPNLALQTYLILKNLDLLFGTSALAVATVNSQPTPRATPTQWYWYSGCRWVAFGYAYEKGSANADPTAAEGAYANLPRYRSYSFGGPANGYSYYGKRSANAVPATEADGQPWWHETFGHGWPNYNYYEKRTTNDTADESTFVLRLISLIVKFKVMVFRMVPFLQGTQFPSE